MMTVKDVGSITLAEEDGKFFLIRCKEEISQGFDSASEAWASMRSGGLRWKGYSIA